MSREVVPGGTPPVGDGAPPADGEMWMPRGRRPPQRVRLRLGVGAAIVLVLVGVAVAVVSAALSPRGSTQVVGGPATPAGVVAGPASTAPSEGSSAGSPAGSAAGSPAEVPADGPAPIYVHILGEVRRPGLYELRAGDRAIDAVAAAGGLTSRADESQLNLARFVTDGEQIVVGRPGAQPVAGAGSAPAGQGAAASGAGGSGGTTSAGPVNINTADAAALESLPGVGPALAQRILDWRAANGRFATVDDLLNVSGIGDKTLDGFRSGVTV